MSEDEPDERPTEEIKDFVARAREKANEIRYYAEIAAVFEGTRKTNASILPAFDGDLARQVQRGMARLDKLRPADGVPILPPEAAEEAAAVLNFFAEKNLATNDYHVYRRPGEVMIARWIAGDEVQAFYERLQAHFDASLSALVDEERQDAWKLTPEKEKYLEELEKLDVKMADRYFRDAIRQHNVFVLSTQTADEMNITFLCEHVMGIDAGDLVGRNSAPQSDQPKESELAWFYKLFLLRGVRDGVEQMCFFTYLQKTDDSFDF